MSLQRRVSDEPCGRRTRAALRRSPARSRPRTDGPARSDDYVGFRPGSGRAVVIDDCIAAFDDGEWLQNRLTADVEARFGASTGSRQSKPKHAQVRRHKSWSLCHAAPPARSMENLAESRSALP